MDSARRSRRRDAVGWRDRVIADAQSDEGQAVARAHHVSPALVLEAARLIAGFIAAGETYVSQQDITLGIFRVRLRQARRVAKYLEARGHIELAADRDMMRPIGVWYDLFR